MQTINFLAILKDVVGKVIILSVIILLIIAGFMVYKQNAKPEAVSITQSPSATTLPVAAKTAPSFDFGNQEVKLDDQTVTIVNGAYQGTDQSANISTSITSKSGTRGAAILVSNPGGSGTFYYVIGAMIKADKQIYSAPVSLGDRIKIVSVAVDDPLAEDNGEITVDYLDRPASAPMSTEPSLKTTKKYSFEDNGNLIEVLH